MPRRKRTTDEGGRRAKVSRVEHNEETLVISDSENEEVLGIHLLCVRLRLKVYVWFRGCLNGTATTYNYHGNNCF